MTVRSFDIGKIGALGLMTALAAGPVTCLAETYYLTQSLTTASTDPSLWKTSGGLSAAAFDSASDYVVCNNLVFQSAGNDTSTATTFNGGRLIVGEVGGTAGTFNMRSSMAGTATFNNEGIVFAKGKITCCAAEPATPPFRVESINGPITVTAPSAAPFWLQAQSFANQNIEFNGPIVGNAGTGLQFCGLNNGARGTMSNEVIRLKGDLSGYAGNLSVAGYTGNGYWPVALEFCHQAATHFGTLSFGDAATVRLTQPQQEIGADKIVFDGTVTLDLARAITTDGQGRSCRTNGTLRAYSEVVVNGTVKIPFDDSTVTDDGVSNRIVVLTFPSTCNVDTTKFKVEYSGRYGDYLLPLTVEQDTVAGVNRLVTGIGAFVHLVAGDYQDKARSSTRTSCFTTASSWSDGRLPHAGVHYLVEDDATYVKSGRADEWVTGKTMTYMRTPDESTATRAFPGESLTLCDGCRLITFCQVFCSPKLVLKDGSQLWVGSSQNTVFSNSFIVAEKGVVELGAHMGGRLDFDATSTLAGDATLALGSITMTGNPIGNYRFASDNSFYSGRIHATQVGSEPAWLSKYQRLAVHAEEELGGDLETLDEKGLVVDLMSIVQFKESVTLRSESNRGIYIGDSAVFDVDAGKDVIVYRQLTMNGFLYKQGNGSLSLGGAVRFDSDDGICDTPRANSNLFTVASGTVKVRSAGAIDGLNVTLGKAAALELTTDAANADLVKYGIRNAKTESPFTLAEGKTTLPLKVDWTGAVLSADKEYTQGILTVTNIPAVVAQARAMLPALAKPITGCKMTKLEIANDDGTLTFALNFKRTGFTIFIR